MHFVKNKVSVSGNFQKQVDSYEPAWKRVINACFVFLITVQ